MATDATRNLRSITRGPSTPRATYDVRSSCMGIGASIFGLLILLGILALM
ncbi:hypothetical protein ACWDPV_08355 [Gordonia sp. NPDC003504]